MTLLFMESFDHHGASGAVTASSDGGLALSRKWGEATFNAQELVTGRFGTELGYELNHSGATLTSPRFSNETELIVGCALKNISAGVISPIRFRAGGSNQVTFQWDGGSVLNALNGSTKIAFGKTNFKTDKWFYVEMRVLISNTVGEVEMYINGVQEFSETGLDTQATGDAFVNEIAFGGALGQSCAIDDIYIIDTNGSTNNTFLGERRVEALLANGVGSNADWTPSAGANWENVDDDPADDDTTYNHTDTTTNTDTFAFTDLSIITQDINGVQINALQRKEDVGSRGLASVTVSGATTEVGATKFVTDEYQYNYEIEELNPNTSTDWTPTTFNAAEFGYRLIS
jgi:hypothetical protein